MTRRALIFAAASLLMSWALSACITEGLCEGPEPSATTFEASGTSELVGGMPVDGPLRVSVDPVAERVTVAFQSGGQEIVQVYSMGAVDRLATGI